MTEDDGSEDNMERRMLRAERALRLGGVGLVMFFGVMAIFSVSRLPEYGRIFESMLGSRDKLWEPTRLALSLMDYPVVGIGIPMILMVLGIWFSVELPRSRALFVVGGCILILSWGRFWIDDAILLPLRKPIPSMSGG